MLAAQKAIGTAVVLAKCYTIQLIYANRSVLKVNGVF